MISESRTTDAIQKYGIERVNAIIQRDNALCSKYILPICRYVYDEKNDINEVLPVIRMVDKTQGIDIYSLSFDELRNQLNVNKPDDYIPLPNPFYFSSDKTVEIGHITSWDESKEIPQAKSWCISRREESWNDFVKNRGYRFFIIRDSKCFYKKNARHVIVTVAKNGSWWFVDSDDDTMVDYHIGNRGDHHMLKSDYIKSIGEGAMKAIQDKITTNENKRYKNMDRKNTIRLTEGDLTHIIESTVAKVLNESFDGTHYFLYLDAEDEKLSTQEIIDRYDELKDKYLPIVIDNTEKWVKSTHYGINTSTCYACSIRYNNGGAMNIFAKRRVQLGSATNNGGHINWSNNSGGRNYWEVIITHFIPTWKLKKERRIVCQTKNETFRTETKEQVIKKINDFLNKNKDIILEIL